MKNKLYSVNLIKNKKKSFFDKFIDWALTVGRVVVIITEIIALAAFLYRFSLDRQLIDLHDKISQQQVIVKSLKTSEEKYRNLQGRLRVAASFIDSGSTTINIFNDIISFAPSDLTFKSLAMSKDIVKIDANLKSIYSLSEFIKSLKNYPNTNWVSLDRIENKTSSSIIGVSLTVVLKKQ